MKMTTEFDAIEDPDDGVHPSPSICETSRREADEIIDSDDKDEHDSNNNHRQNDRRAMPRNINNANEMNEGDVSKSNNTPRKRRLTRLEEVENGNEANYNKNTVSKDRAARSNQRLKIPNSDVVCELSSDEENGICPNTCPPPPDDPMTARARTEHTSTIMNQNMDNATNLSKRAMNESSKVMTSTPPLRRSSRISAASSDGKKDNNQCVDLVGEAGMMATYKGPTNMIFVYPPGKRGSIRVTEEERGRLKEKLYLNDSLIDFYIKYLEKRYKKRRTSFTDNSMFFSSFFFGRLTQRSTKSIDYEGVKSWTKNIDIFSQKYVFVPICESYHWSLMVIVNLNNLHLVMDKGDALPEFTPSEKPAAFYLDSLDPERGSEFGDSLSEYLAEEWFARKVAEEDKTDEKKQSILEQVSKLVDTNKPKIPMQNNEYDCGLYLLQCLQMFLSNKENFEIKLINKKPLSNAFCHIHIHKLRMEIIELMNLLEESWNWRTGQKLLDDQKTDPYSKGGKSAR